MAFDVGFVLFASWRLIWVSYGLRRAVNKKHILFDKFLNKVNIFELGQL